MLDNTGKFLAEIEVRKGGKENSTSLRNVAVESKVGLNATDTRNSRIQLFTASN